MTVTSQQLTITTTPQIIWAGDSANDIFLHVSQGTCFIGNATVTSTTGYQMDNGDKITIPCHETPLYACTSTGTGTLSILQVSK